MLGASRSLACCWNCFLLKNQKFPRFKLAGAFHRTAKTCSDYFLIWLKSEKVWWKSGEPSAPPIPTHIIKPFLSFNRQQKIKQIKIDQNQQSSFSEVPFVRSENFQSTCILSVRLIPFTCFHCATECSQFLLPTCRPHLSPRGSSDHVIWIASERARRLTSVLAVVDVSPCHDFTDGSSGTQWNVNRAIKK